MRTQVDVVASSSIRFLSFKSNQDTIWGDVKYHKPEQGCEKKRKKNKHHDFLRRGGEMISPEQRQSRLDCTKLGREPHNDRSLMVAAAALYIAVSFSFFLFFFSYFFFLGGTTFHAMLLDESKSNKPPHAGVVSCVRWCPWMTQLCSAKLHAS